VSKASSEERLRPGFPDGPGGMAAPAARTLHVQAVFRDVDEKHVQTVAAEMIARAHELANRPEFECDVDVDVSVQGAAAIAPVHEC
jgi:hypothetical protein